MFFLSLIHKKVRKYLVISFFFANFAVIKLYKTILCL